MGRASRKTDNAFGNSVTEANIEAAITKLCNRVKCTLKTPVVSYREMLQLIAPAEHIEFLLNARRIGDIGRYPGRDSDQIVIANHRGVNVGVEFSVSGQDETPVMPYKPWLHHSPENKALINELVRCAKEFADVAIDWGVVKAVYKYLNKHCKSPAQVRYFWPSILGIMSLNEDLDDVRASIIEHTMPRGLPSLPPEVRALCRQTAGIVATALLLPPLEDEPHVPEDVTITFKADSGAMVVGGYYVYPIN